MTRQVNINEGSLPTIALVGRVNVGKSTLFNKLTEEQKAITSEEPGTTRTSNTGIIVWRGMYLRIIDTGGLTFEDNVLFEDDILKQSEVAMKTADIVLFVVSTMDGIMPQERELAKRMRRITEKPVLLVANKSDNKRLENEAMSGEWLQLGLGEPFPVSAANGRNSGDLLDKIYQILNEIGAAPSITNPTDIELIRVSLIGKPNVGKSSIFNKLIGEDRAIVSDIPHTTREPHDVLVNYTYDVPSEDEETGSLTVTQPILFVDTAGIRRKSQVGGEIERAGIQKSIEAIDRSEIVLFTIDSSEVISQQDMQLGGLLEKHAKSVLILVNKWDLAEDNSETKRNKVKKFVSAHFPHLDFAPILFVSGSTGEKIHQIFPTIIKAEIARRTEIPTNELAHFLERVTREKLPSKDKGTRHPKILGLRQIGTNPPVFEMLIKYRTSLHRSYVNYIENKLRERWDFFATPIIIRLTKQRR